MEAFSFATKRLIITLAVTIPLATYTLNWISNNVQKDKQILVAIPMAVICTLPGRWFAVKCVPADWEE